MSSLDGNTRSFRNLQRKFIEYLIPATITGVAASLNEFADSLVVSNLLDSKALSVVNLGSTIAFIGATVYVILGRGGSTLYALSLGRHDKRGADRYFTLAILFAFLFCIVIGVPGLLFSDSIAGFLAKGSGLEQEFSSYLRVKIIAGIPMLLTLTFTYFFTSAGHPVMTTVITIVPNVLNLLLDLVFIGFLGMGVEGAAWASFSGFSVAFVMILVLMATGKVNLKFEKITAKSIKEIRSILATGASSATIQIGYAIKTAFCNLVAAGYAGYLGITAFSLCMQTLSLISIFISGILDAIIPLSCALTGLHDRQGERYLIHTACKIQTIVSVLLVAILEIRPEIMMTLYSVTDAGADLIVLPAIRIFSLALLYRWIYVFFMYLCTVHGRKIYAFAISVADGFALVVLFTLLLTPALGLDGMWWAFPLSSAVILLSIFIVNKTITKKSGGQFRGFWLLEKEAGIIADITVYDHPENISGISEQIEQLCAENGMDRTKAMLTAVALEEMCVITQKFHEENDGVLIDVLISTDGDSYVMNLRSCGEPFSPSMKEDEAVSDSYKMLKKISTSIQYDYVLGLNTTRIEI